jgi:hypothetical protein
VSSYPGDERFAAEQSERTAAALASRSDAIVPCDFAVEATDYERLCLWREWHDEQRRVTWQEESRGLLVTVGHVGDRPVCVCLCWATIDGRRVVFYHASSQIVDHPTVEAWVRATAMTPGGTHTNAMNFHVVAHAIERANVRGAT